MLARAFIISDDWMNVCRIMRHIRRGNVTNELQTSRHEVHYHKQDSAQRDEAKQTRAWDTSSRAYFCTEAATGAGATTDSAGGNGSSRSSGSVVSFCESALSRTGLVAEFAGEVDSSWWVACDEACGMLRLNIKIRSTRKPQGNTLLWIGNCRPHSVL
jgi:hypothetical protein